MNISSTHWQDKLESWYATERSAGRAADLKVSCKTYEEYESEGKVFTDEEKNDLLERTARAVYETLTGQRSEVDISARPL